MCTGWCGTGPSPSDPMLSGSAFILFPIGPGNVVVLKRGLLNCLHPVAERLGDLLLRLSVTGQQEVGGGG
eukprot:5432222-Pyramimonas_sp.AAC.1